VVVFEGNVGTANFGTIQSINQSIGSLVQGGDQQLGTGLQEITQAVLDSGLAEDDKKQVLDQLAYLGREANKQPDEQERSVARTVVAAVGQTLVAANTALADADKLADIWHRVEPLITQTLRLGQ
jgi:molybdopterin converting factor small subunit